MYLKKVIIYLLVAGFTTSLKAQIKSNIIFSIENNTSLNYVNKVVEINWDDIKVLDKKIDTSNIVITDASNKAQLIFQLVGKDNARGQQLLIELSVKPYQNKKIIIFSGKHMPFVAKTFGRYVPERKDDFAWENNKIAFRMYGRELEKTPKEMGLGVDVWVKRTEKMILNERYKRGEYHIDHGDGMDYYHVGLSLGAGNMMPYQNDSIYFSRNYVTYKVINNGPLRTTFQLMYDDWMVDKKVLSATKTISLDAGSQLSKITVEYKSPEMGPIPVVAGLVTRKENGIKYLNEQDGIMAYWEPKHGEDGTTGVGCIFMTAVSLMTTDKLQLLSKTETDNNKIITYYSGAAWDKAGEIKTGKAWFAYLQNFKEELIKPLKIVLIK